MLCDPTPVPVGRSRPHCHPALGASPPRPLLRNEVPSSHQGTHVGERSSVLLLKDTQGQHLCFAARSRPRWQHPAPRARALLRRGDTPPGRQCLGLCALFLAIIPSNLRDTTAGSHHGGRSCHSAPRGLRPRPVRWPPRLGTGTLSLPWATPAPHTCLHTCCPCPRAACSVALPDPAEVPGEGSRRPALQPRAGPPVCTHSAVPSEPGPRALGPWGVRVPPTSTGASGGL